MWAPHFWADARGPLLVRYSKLARWNGAVGGAPPTVPSVRCESFACFPILFREASAIGVEVSSDEVIQKVAGRTFLLSQYKSYRTCGEHHSNEVNVSVRRIPPEYPPKPSLGVQHSGRGPNMLSIAAFVAAYVVAIAVHEARPGVYSSRETVLSCPRDTRDVTVYLCAAHAEMLLRHSGYYAHDYACDARLSLCSGLVPCVACGCAFSPGHGVNMIVYHVVSCTACTVG